jgi:hypothetical protein
MIVQTKGRVQVRPFQSGKVLPLEARMMAAFEPKRIRLNSLDTLPRPGKHRFTPVGTRPWMSEFGWSGLASGAVAGDTPNLAARLQALADADQIVIDELTPPLRQSHTADC